jgi:hypothetical protein
MVLGGLGGLRSALSLPSRSRFGDLYIAFRKKSLRRNP